MRLSIAYAVDGAIVGEMFASQKGIGNLLTAGQGDFNMAEILAGLLAVAIVDAIGRYAEAKFLR